MLLLGLMVFVLFIFGCRKLENRMPFKGLSSYAISAAYQPLTEDEDIALQPLMWGVLREPTKDKPEHCGFTTEEVAGPVEGQWYW
jgi:hypothetical protein